MTLNFLSSVFNEFVEEIKFKIKLLICNSKNLELNYHIHNIISFKYY